MHACREERGAGHHQHRQPRNNEETSLVEPRRRRRLYEYRLVITLRSSPRRCDGAKRSEWRVGLRDSKRCAKFGYRLGAILGSQAKARVDPTQKLGIEPGRSFTREPFERVLQGTAD